ncbi:MAG TPA: histidine phosphatase family protein [Peptococcaceae bacterium]|nr:histidine phosphatase family protein [Peptococcaceae bacterium]
MIYNLYLIRHAKTQANLEGRYRGASDEPLSAAGLQELKKRIRLGYYPKVDQVYVSPRQRCLQTAQIIYPGLPLKVVPGFDEYNFGIFEGKSYEELKNNPAYRKWIASGGKERAPGGEDIETYKLRCCRAFAEVVEEIRQEGFKDTALVVHGGTIMAILERYIHDEKKFYDWQVPNTQGYKLFLEDEHWQREKIISTYQPFTAR